MTSVLTSDQIEYLIDFIKPQKGIPEKTALSLMEYKKNELRSQLNGQSIYPELLNILKANLFKTWKDSQIQPGESVGVICAQSIGEKNTQTALNTFHKAGQSEKTMTEGVPRFQELLNATKNPKIVNHKIYFKKGSDTVKNLRNIVANKITHYTLKDISNTIEIVLDKKREDWYEIFEKLYNKDITGLKHCIKVTFDNKKIYENKLTYFYICNVLENNYNDITCIFSPSDEMYIFPDVTEVQNKIMEPIAYITPENSIEIFLEDVVKPVIQNIDICGIKGITEIFYTKEDDEWFLETNAETVDSDKINMLNSIMKIDIVDENRTVSNNIWEIYKTLGIQATKQFLIEEFMSIMEGINSCHAQLLVDRMTFNGTIESISRYTLKNDNCGPLGKASFEESLDNFLNASLNGEVETTNGVSASIICGKRSNIGTGMMNLKMEF